MKGEHNMQQAQSRQRPARPIPTPDRRGAPTSRQQSDAPHPLGFSCFLSSQHVVQRTFRAGVRSCTHPAWLGKGSFIKRRSSDFLDPRLGPPQRFPFLPHTTLVTTEFPRSQEAEKATVPLTNLVVNYKCSSVPQIRKSAPNPRCFRLNHKMIS